MDIKIKLPQLNQKRHGSLEKNRARAGYVFVLPFLLGVVLIYLPILVDSIWFSFNEEVATNIYFRGWELYKKALTQNSGKFLQDLLAGIQQLIFEVPAVIVFSLFIAVVLNQKMLGRAAFRAIFFVPVIISTGIMESINISDQLMGSSGNGINDGSGTSSSGLVSALDIEALFKEMKVGSEIVTYVVDLVNSIYDIINYSGVQMLIFLAGLQSISPSIYEACQIEGATAWETFWKITLPMISPMILVNAVYTIIDSFTRKSNITMGIIDAETNGSLASAMSWIYFVVIILIIAAFAAIASAFVFYQRRD